MNSVVTIPNAISAIRIALVPVFVWLVFGPEDTAAAGWLLGAIGATDWIDGYLARRLNQVSEVGKFLDPLADRLAVAAAVVAGWISGVLPWWFAALLVVRESLVAMGAAVVATKARTKLEVRRLGKVATFGLYVAIPNFYIFDGTGWDFHGWVAWIFGIPGLVLYYAVGFQYAGDVRGVLRRRPVSSGPTPRQETGGGDAE